MCRNIRYDVFFAFTEFMGWELNRASVAEAVNPFEEFTYLLWVVYSTCHHHRELSSKRSLLEEVHGALQHESELKLPSCKGTLGLWYFPTIAAHCILYWRFKVNTVGSLFWAVTHCSKIPSSYVLIMKIQTCLNEPLSATIGKRSSEYMIGSCVGFLWQLEFQFQSCNKYAYILYALKKQVLSKF